MAPLVTLPHAAHQLLLQSTHVEADHHQAGATTARSSGPEGQEAADHLQFAIAVPSEVDVPLDPEHALGPAVEEGLQPLGMHRLVGLEHDALVRRVHVLAVVVANDVVE
jgi:hypothetical protein